MAVDRASIRLKLEEVGEAYYECALGKDALIKAVTKPGD